MSRTYLSRTYPHEYIHSNRTYTHVCIQIYTYTHGHVQMHTCTNAYIHMYKCRCYADIYMFKCACAHTHVQTRTSRNNSYKLPRKHVHKFAQTEMLTYMQHARMQTCARADIHACRHARMQTCTHADMHACRHACMLICTHADRKAC